MDSLISIITVNYNGKKWLKKLFDSLLCQTYKNFEIIFVDNGSVDDSVEFIKNNYKDDRIKIIKSDKNLGFARGNNLGFKSSRGEYILLLNNDTWIGNHFIEKIYNYLLINNLDVVAPREADYNGLSLPYSDNRTIDILGHPFFLKNKIRKIFYLQGFCLIFNRNLYKLTGGLDNNFFMYCEETDWFWRLNLLNKKFGLNKNVCVNHAGSGSTGKGLKYNIFLWRNQNTLQMLMKNYQWFNLLWVLPLYILQNIFEIIFFLIILKPKFSYSYIEGWIFNIKNIRKILEKRRLVQRDRKIRDSEIIKKMYWGPGKLKHLFDYIKK
ncbi:MAG: glycosyltransferase family 2 protein [Candidatus Taylorbacteria bacterium]|nr:glycosyltransferase family 2 protein [Candidatus Taylorbacteria bacterium]